MSDWPSNSEAAGEQSQHYESTQNEVLHVWDEHFAKDPTTDSASMQEIKEEMVVFFCHILGCYDCVFGLLNWT
jgi:hypothetical protein